MILMIAVPILLRSLDGVQIDEVTVAMEVQPILYAVINLCSKPDGDGLFIGRGSLKQVYEYVMPPVEIDRYIRGISYLSIKGRNLVRLAPSERG